jgi:hypothetical protein
MERGSELLRSLYLRFFNAPLLASFKRNVLLFGKQSTHDAVSASGLLSHTIKKEIKL